MLSKGCSLLFPAGESDLDLAVLTVSGRLGFRVLEDILFSFSTLRAFDRELVGRVILVVERVLLDPLVLAVARELAERVERELRVPLDTDAFSRAVFTAIGLPRFFKVWDDCMPPLLIGAVRLLADFAVLWVD
jgi:hypothetical protein